MMQYKHLLLLTILVSTCYSQTTEPSPAEYRLNELHKPTSYTIEIIPYLTSEGTNAELTFDSSVSILFIAKAANNYIRLNAAESLIFDKTKTSLTIVGGVQIPITNTVLTTNPKTEILTLNLGSPLEVDKTYRLFFEYKGSIAEDMKGFYRSSYNESGVTVLLGSTQFQPTYARKVFPCWDEPNYKAIFTLSVIKPVEYGVISNTKESTTVPVGINGLKNKVTFESTPEMSTYLLAFIISKFTRRPSDSFSVWARPDQYKQTEYSFQVGKLLVTEMGNYLDSPYSAQLNKMDMAAIPDFSAGAMENWGLLTYRETALLYDEQDTPLLRKQYIAAVVAHEIAHMWFGDLVTCDWWEHIWLNEGFATYFEYFATNKVEKQFEMEKQFTIEIRRALLFDSTGESHPLSHPVVTQEQAMNIFDVIVYEKAAAVIRMMEHMIGSVAFQTGLKTYISTFAKKNVIPSDLLTHLFTVNVNMATYFNSWITKKGYPMIYVAFDENRSQATITQKHFTLDGGLDETIKYPIPLTFTVKSGDFSNVTPKPEHIFTEDKADMKISIDGKNWVIFNNQQSGFYRVNYDQKSWDLIQTALNLPEHDGIDEINRAQIVDDLFNFARAGVVTYTFALEFMEYLPQENQYLPWQTAFESFAFISSRLPTGDLPKFRAYVNDITNNIFVKLGFGNKGTHLDIYNRANVINWACKSGNLQCISTANEYFSLYRDEGFKIPVNIRAPILCTAMRQGNMTDFNFMWSEYLNADVSTEKTTLLNAFGCAQDPDILQALLLEIFTNSDVRTQDKRAAFNSIFTNSEENLDYVLDYVTKNHIKVDNGFKGGKSELIKTLTQLAARFTTASQHKIYKDFVEAQKTYFDADQLLMLDVSATVDKNLAWIEKNKPDIMNYIEKRSKGSGATEIKSFSVVLLITSFVLILTNILQ